MDERLLEDSSDEVETKETQSILNAASTRSLRRKVSDLPDLTGRLMEQGIHDEYQRWRDKYMAWRRGETQGARGEYPSGTRSLGSCEDMEFQHWYPTVTTFKFRRTCFFWCNVCCVEGCLLFLWIPLFTQCNFDPDLQFELTKLPNLCGGLLFTLGIYLAYFELINLDSDVEEATVYFFKLPWQQLMELNVSPLSPAISLTYLVGATLYGIAQVAEVAGVDGTANEEDLVSWPYCIGGFCFFVGGFCELLLNEVFTSPPIKFVWWISLLNSLGGLGFWISACPSLLQGELAENVGAAGTSLYMVAAVISLMMWRGEQFGGSIIPVLNNAQRGENNHIRVRKDKQTGVYHIIAVEVTGDKRGDKLKDHLNPKLSWRGLLFVQVFTFIGATQVLSCCAVVTHFQQPTDYGFRKNLNVFFSGIGNFLLAHMTLVLNSACVTAPKEQPYYALVMMLRGASLMILANSILTLRVLLDTP